MEFHEGTPHVELVDVIHVESSLDLILTPPILHLSFPFIFHSYFDPHESTCVESETFVSGSPCLDQSLDDTGIEKLKDHIEGKDLT